MTATEPAASDPIEPMEWLARFADVLGVDVPDRATIDTLLELAGVAAHASQRTAAPIACYLVGRAGADVVAALRAVALGLTARSDAFVWSAPPGR